MDLLRDTCAAPRVAIVVVNWNAGPLLDRCLAAIAAQTRRADRVIVVDNASTPGPLDETMRRFPGVEFDRLATNTGFAAANNRAILAAADCEWIALLNPDAFPEPGWLAALLAASEEHPDCAAFGSLLLCADDPTRIDGTGDVYHVSGLAWRRDHGRPASARPRPAGEIFSPCAAAALYRRDAFLEVGGFDEDYFCYHEDVDLGFRLGLAGYVCRYVPEAVALHLGSALSGRRSDFAAYHGHRNLVWTFVKDMPRPLFWAFLPVHVLLDLVTLAALALRGQGRIALRAKRDAWRGFGAALAKRRSVQARRRAGSLALLRRMAWSVKR